MNRKYLAFDIETAKTTDDGIDWRSCRPLGISCAATLPADSKELVLWHGGKDRKCPADRMSQQEAGKLVDYLATQVGNGYTIVTWNGLGYDFDILAEESGMFEDCPKLATNHVDMMFHVLCELGYAVGLDAAAKGMGLAGKTEGMNGAIAPVLWAEGRREEVLGYVAQDVRTTLELATTCEAQAPCVGTPAAANCDQWHCRRDGLPWRRRGGCQSPIRHGFLIRCRGRRLRSGWGERLPVRARIPRLFDRPATGGVGIEHPSMARFSKLIIFLDYLWFQVSRRSGTLINEMPISECFGAENQTLGGRIGGASRKEGLLPGCKISIFPKSHY